MLELFFHLVTYILGKVNSEMLTRLELQALLEEDLGSKNVYYHPPSNTKMSYPCYVYSFNNIDTRRADNKNYLFKGEWSITHIYKNIADEHVVEFLKKFPTARHTNHRYFDGLWHDYYSFTNI